MNVGIYTDCSNGMVGIGERYMSYAEKFGTPHLINNYNFKQFLSNEIPLGLLIVPGGSDVFDSNNGPPSYTNGRANPFYEYLDRHFLKKVLFSKYRKYPILGICRGMQTINNILGGTLYQNIVGHVQQYSREVSEQKVFIQFENESLFTYKVNSLHHQAINQLASGLTPFAYARTFTGCESLYEEQLVPCLVQKNQEIVEALRPGIIEGFISKEMGIIGVQWHPEEFQCNITKKIVKEMMKNAKNESSNIQKVAAATAIV